MNPFLTQANFAIRSDDTQGLNSSLTGLNVDSAIDLETRFRIRFELVESNGTNFNGTIKLQYNINSGGWNDVLTTPLDWSTRTNTGLVEAVDSKQYADADATTDILIGSSAPFIAGEGVENDNLASVGPIHGEHTEIEFCLLLHRIADGPVFLNDGDTIQFRMVQSDNTLLDAYINTPTVTVNYPAGLIGGCYIENPGNIGPFLDGNDNLYFVVEPTETDNQMLMMKSTDSGDTWSEVDGANRPSTADLEGVHIIQLSTQLFIFHNKGTSGDVRLHIFDTSDAGATADTWTTTDEQIDAGLLDNFDQQIAAFERSDGSIVCAYSGDHDDPATSPHEVWYNIRSSGGTWGTPALLWKVTGNDYGGVVGCIDPVNDHVYFFSCDSTNGDIDGKRINGSTDAMEDLFGNSTTSSAEGTVVDTNVRLDEQNHTIPIFFDSNKILIGWQDATTEDGETVVITVGSGGSIGTVGGTINDDLQLNYNLGSSQRPTLEIIRDPSDGTFYSFFGKSDNTNLNTGLYMATSSNSGSTWGSDTTFSKRSPKSRINWVKGNIIEPAAGKFIALVYDDASGPEQNNNATGGSTGDRASGYATGFIWYDTYELAAGPATLSSSGVVGFSNTLLRDTSNTTNGTVSSSGDTIKGIFNSISGTISTSGIILSLVDNVIQGVVNTSGNIFEIVTNSITGILSNTGSLSINNVYNKFLSGVIFFGAAANQFTQDVAGTLTSSGDITSTVESILSSIITSTGNIINNISITILGNLTSTGNIISSVSNFLSSTIDSSGNIINDITKPISGIIALSGSTFKSILQTMTGTISSIGTILHSISRLIGGVASLSGSVNRNLIKTLLGVITSSGITLKSFISNITGIITSSSTLVNDILKSMIGVLSSSGNTIKNVTQSFIGSISSSGFLDNIKVVLVTFTGTLTSSGQYLSNIVKDFIGTITSSGSIIKEAQSNLVGSLSLIGILSTIKAVLHTITGSIASSGQTRSGVQNILSGVVFSSGQRVSDIAATMVGTITSSGSALKDISTQIAGTILHAGSIVSNVQKNISGILTFSGITNNIKTILQTVTGVLNNSAVIVNSIQKQLLGSISFTGTLQSYIDIIVAGVSNLAGVVSNIAQGANEILVTGVINPAGSVAKSITQDIIANINSIGTITTSVLKDLLGSITFSGIISNTKVVLLNILGAITSSSTYTNVINKTVSGIISLPGNITRNILTNVTGIVNNSASIIKSITSSTSGILTFSGIATSIRTILLQVIGTITFSSSIIRRVVNNISGAISSSSNISIDIVKFISSSLSSVGSTTKNLIISISGIVGLSGIANMIESALNVIRTIDVLAWFRDRRDIEAEFDDREDLKGKL